MNPEPGTYLRPVGHLRFGYCLEVVTIITADRGWPEQWVMRRWGLRNGQPIQDGGPRGDAALQYLPHLRCVAPEVWRDDDEPWPLGPVYYRRIEFGQRELFA